MIIGIDGNEANVENRVGISEYAFELLKQFKQSNHMQFKIYLKDTPLHHMPEESENWHYVVFGPRKLWTQFALPVRLFTEKNKPDIFFSPSHYAPRFNLIPNAIAVMDVSYLRFPELFAKKDLYQLQQWTAYSVKQAKKIFTISESSKNDILSYYKVPEEKVIVTYPGIKVKNPTSKSNTMEEIQKKYNIGEQYILFVGTIQPRKNINRLIEAFNLVLEKHPKTQLVIVGKKGWLYEPIFVKPKELGIEERVKFLDFVPNKDLPALYQHAICYCLPSLYEGFGLPVLEAMQYDCPVVTSNVSSLPEAGGDAALYVNPESVEDIAKKLIEMIEDKKLRSDLIKKGHEQVKKFSWEKTAKQTLTVLESLIK